MQCSDLDMILLTYDKTDECFAGAIYLTAKPVCFSVHNIVLLYNDNSYDNLQQLSIADRLKIWTVNFFTI